MNEPAPVGKTISDGRIQAVSLMVLAGIAGVFSVYWLRPVLVPFIVACFIVSGVTPILAAVENRLGVSRLMAAFMTFLCCLTVLGIFGLTLFVSIMDLSANAGAYQDRVYRLTAIVQDVLPIDALSPDRFRRPGETETDEIESGTVPLESQHSEENLSPAIGSTAGVSAVIEDDSPADQAGETQTPGGTPVDDTVSLSASNPLPASSELAKSPGPGDLSEEVVPVSGKRKVPPFVDAFVRQGISVVSQALVNLVSTSVVVLIYVFFLLLGSPTYASAGTVREIDSQIRGYLSLKTLISIATGAVFGLTLYLFGVPMALSFGVLAFLLNFIPNIGPMVASLLPIPLILLDPSGNILWMIAVITATSLVQLISGNVVEPKMMGNSSDLHPVTILLALMFWGMMWGIIGMFLATPITAAIKIVLERFEPTRQLANVMAGRWEESDSFRGEGHRPEEPPFAEATADGLV